MSQFRSKRFAEYFPPFAILFAAFSWQEFLKPLVAELPEDFKRDIEPYLDTEKPSQKEQTWQILKTAGLWTLGIVLSCVMFYNFIGVDFSTNETVQKTPWLKWLIGN